MWSIIFGLVSGFSAGIAAGLVTESLAITGWVTVAVVAALASRDTSRR